MKRKFGIDLTQKRCNKKQQHFVSQIVQVQPASLAAAYIGFVQF